MKKIEFDERNIIGIFNEGIESIIYLYKLGNDIVLFKRIKNQIQLKTKIKIVDDSVFKNKEKKVELIQTMPCFKDEVQILGSMYDKNRFIGYVMPLDNSFLKTVNGYLRKKYKIMILKQLREKIEKLNSNGVYICDINERNILLSNDYIIKLCDLDNMKIGEYDKDIESILVQNFNEKCDKKDYIDSYCFNLFTVCLLDRIDPPGIIYYIENDNLPKILRNKENWEILQSMKFLDNNYQKKYLIDNLN